VIAFYGRTLNSSFASRPLHCCRDRHAAADSFLYYEIPKGFFPIQDTGVIQGVTEASQSVSFSEMSRLQQSVVKTLLKDPAVESLSSFIGSTEQIQR